MNKWTKIAVLCVGLMLQLNGLQAAPEKAPVPTQLDGDVITYISKTGIMTAQGGVKLTQGTAVLTGDIGEYNTKTKEAVVTGNVKVVKEGSTLTAAEVRAYDEMKRLVATGKALLVHKDGKPGTKAALDFFRWVYANGDASAAALGYVPLPNALVQQVEAYWTQNVK